jgi:hypothetical protein
MEQFMSNVDNRFPEGQNEGAGLEDLIDFWNKLRVLDDPGGTTWSVLEELEREVTDCLMRGSAKDHLLAHRLTARALRFFSS